MVSCFIITRCTFHVTHVTKFVIVCAPQVARSMMEKRITTGPKIVMETTIDILIA